jgi:hypothetical protein
MTNPHGTRTPEEAEMERDHNEHMDKPTTTRFQAEWANPGSTPTDGIFNPDDVIWETKVFDNLEDAAMHTAKNGLNNEGFVYEEHFFQEYDEWEEVDIWSAYLDDEGKLHILER